MARIVCAAALCVTMLASPAFADIDYWRIRSAPGFVRDLVVDPTDATVVWAALSNAATTYGDLGTTTGIGIGRSADGGATFVPRNNGLTNLLVTSIAIDPSAPSTVYAGTKGGGVFRTTDAGASWTPRNVGLANLNVLTVAVDPQNPMTLYAGLQSGGLARSTNAGLSWTATTGMGNLDVWEVAFAPGTPTTRYAASSLGVRKSVDGGLSWSSTGSMVIQPAGEAPQQVGDARAVLVDAATPDTVYAGMWSGAGVFKSTNGGATWTHTSTGLLSRYGNWRFVNRLAQDPTAPDVLYATTTAETYRSLDGGLTWVVFSAGLSRGEAYGLATSSTGGAFIASVFGDVHALATRPSGVDHFRCLKAKGRGLVQRTLSVTDRFGSDTVTILKPYRLCVPTSPSGDPIVDPTTYLTCYKVQGGAVPPIFIPFLTNRLDGYRAYEVNRNDTLCVPSYAVGFPSAQPRDAYRCLRGPRYASAPLDLVLSDALGTQPIRKTRVDRLCSPTDVDGAGRIEPDVGLRCDKLSGPPRPAPTAPTVLVEDQFGVFILKVGRTDSHCVQALDSRS